MIPLKVHNVLDYVVGAALSISPWIFGFADIEAAKNVFLVLGLGLIGYSALTRYPYSLAKLIPLGVHMGLDATAGVVLMLAPWIFGYQGLITSGQLAAHFIYGLGAIALVLFTRPKRDRPALVREEEYRRVA